MGRGTVYLDFEFSKIVEPKVNLVSCATYVEKTDQKMVWWLHNSPKRQSELAKYLKQFEVVVGYACVAEARSFLALGLNPLDFKWIDLFLEYRMLTNHNDELQWGWQLVDGKPKFFTKPKPKWERTEEDAQSGFKATHSLAEATYKLTRQIRDTEHKDKTRQLIISDPARFAPAESKQILAYNLEDVVFLPEIWKRIKQEFRKLAPDDSMEDYFREAINRGRYSAHTAIMETTGYPIDVEATRNFSRQIPHILMECQRDINDQFPEIKPFKWNKRSSNFSWNQIVTRNWIEEHHDVERWMKTDSGKLSLALDAFERFYPFKHDYPRGNFGAQMVRYLKLKQSLYGFSETGGKRKNFWDSVGSDGRVRPYMNIYGAQSSRSQPAASGFMFLKPAWMRSLVMPKKGKFIAGIDYGQQEFFVSALESECPNMIEAYLSGDPYLHTAKLCGAVPMDGKREDFKAVRDLFKSTTLGISYLMTKFGLAIKLTNDTGREWTEDEAQEQIDLFYDAYPELKEYQENLMEAYQDGCGIRLPCVAEGTEIVTQYGNKKIEDVGIHDKIWDGNEWQSHGGVVRRGAKAVIRDNGAGLTATPDHLVLCGGVWYAWLEVLADDVALKALRSEKFSADGRLLAENSGLKVGAMSLVAAYVELKKTFASMPFAPETLEPVLSALNLSAPKDAGPEALAEFFLTNIFGDVGRLVTAMQSAGAKTPIARTSGGMVLAAYDSCSSPFESSWNTLLYWMGAMNGESPWTELIMTGTMNPETYESLLKVTITEIKETFDIAKAGPLNRFQAGKAIVHNCGWRMWCDNDNLRSVCNVPIQGFGASVMRKAVDLAVGRGCSVIFTLHDAIYIEGDVGDERKIFELSRSMREAFQYYYRGTKYYEVSGQIKLDPFAWSPDFPKDSEIIVGFNGFDPITVPVSNKYIDERGINEFNRFSRYFNAPDTDLL